MTPAQLRDIRTGRGLTQEALATALGVKRLSVWRWEAGTRPISDRTALAVANLPHDETGYAVERRIQESQREKGE